MEEQRKVEPQEHRNTAELPVKLAKKHGQPWWVLVLMATLPPLTTAFFSYRASVVEAKVKAAEAKRTAEKGYEELVRAVELLQKHDDESMKSIAELNGHVKSIEAWMTGMKPHTELHSRELHLDLPVPRNATDQAHWRPNFPPPVATAPVLEKRVALPRSLDEAAKK